MNNNVKSITFLLIFTFFISQSQIKNPTQEMLLDYERQALYFEAKKDYHEALKLYYQIKTTDSVSDLSKRSDNKIDYLLPICRKATVDKLKGKWKLKKKLRNEEADIIFTSLIVFIEEKIIFIEDKDCKEKEILSQDLLIEAYPQKTDSDFPTIRFGKNEVWVLSFREINNEKRLIWEQRVDKNGNKHFTLDERRMIKNPLIRKKALDDEVHTYYVKIE